MEDNGFSAISVFFSLVLGFEAGKRRRTNGVLGVRISPEKRVKGAGVFGVWWSAFGRV